MTNRERRKQYRKRMADIRNNHRQGMADINRNHNIRMAEITKEGNKKTADIKAQGKINISEINKKYRDRAIIRELEHSNNPNATKIATKKLNQSENNHIKKVNKSLRQITN